MISMKTILMAICAFTLCGCANPGVVMVSPGTYMLCREDHAGIYGNPGRMKANVLTDMNAFAAKNGKCAIPISAKEHPVGVLADWASFTVIFKLVETNDPAAQKDRIFTSSQQESSQGWRNLGGKATVYPEKH